MPGRSAPGLGDPRHASPKDEGFPERARFEGKRNRVALSNALLKNDARPSEPEVLHLDVRLPARAHVGEKRPKANGTAGVCPEWAGPRLLGSLSRGRAVTVFGTGSGCGAFGRGRWGAQDRWGHDYPTFYHGLSTKPADGFFRVEKVKMAYRSARHGTTRYGGKTASDDPRDPQGPPR